MEQVVTLAVPLGILYAILQRLPAKGYQTGYRSAIKWGFWLSIAIVVARVGTRNAVSREGVEGIAITIAFLAEIVCIVLLARGRGQEEKPYAPLKYSAIVLGLLLFFYHGMEIWFIPVGSAISAAGDYTSTNFFVKLAGFGAGFLFGCIGSYVVYRAAAALNDKRLVFVFIVQALAMMVQQGIFLVQLFLARHIISSESVLSLMAPIIDHSSWLIFIIFFAVLFVPITLYSQKRPARPADMNPARYRRLIQGVIHKRRWGAATVVALIFMVAFSSFGSSYANKQVELVKPQPVVPVGDHVDLPLGDVNDGHLHRFVYQASGGQQVRFIVILKGGNSYGVGLDACEICGPTGYYERDNQVVCRLCDVVMNKATIGTKGGCNPIPLEHQVTEGNLRIPVEALEAANKIFN